MHRILMMVVFFILIAAEVGATQEELSAMEVTAKANADAGIVWVTIPGGSFMMGDEDWSYTKPVHMVTINSFEMAKTEVTNKQYQVCVEAEVCTPAHVSDGTCFVYNQSSGKFDKLPPSFLSDNQPVVCVDWDQANTFSKWVGGRLPTEAEWEYAARSAGKDQKYPWGNENAVCARAVVADGERGCGIISTWPVCSKPKGNTKEGLCDMAGNVWELIQDNDHASYVGAPTDGSAWKSFTNSRRIVRGGSWFDDAKSARATSRLSNAAGTSYSDCGLRPVRVRLK